MKFESSVGWWLPDEEEHLQEWMHAMKQQVDGRLCYQRHKYLAALQFIPANQRDVAVDVGAHVGLWSWMMARDFASVIAFEPVNEHADCWVKNMAGFPDHTTLYRCALGEHSGTVRVTRRTPNSSGDSGVEPDPKAANSSLTAAVQAHGQETQLRRLDDFDISHIDLLKLDTEGYELFILRGGEETVKRCKPVIIVEQKPETGGSQRYNIGVMDAVDFLKSLGMKQRAAIQGDYVMVWD